MRILIATMFAIALIAPSGVAQSDAVDDGEACRAANDQKEYDKAIELCTRSLAAGSLANDQRAVALTNRAFAYRAKRDYATALRDLSDAIRLWPEYLIAYQDRGQTYRGLGENDRAIADYNKVLSAHPDDHTVLVYRASAYTSKADFDRAIADYDAVIRGSPNGVVYWFRGDVRAMTGNFEAAVKDYDRAIAAPRVPFPANYQRGKAYVGLGKWDSAEADFETARKADPAYVEVVLWLAIVLRQQHRDAESMALLASPGKGPNSIRWPAVVVLYYQGRASRQDVMNATRDSNPRLAALLGCEAVFYIGMFERTGSEKELARSDLEKARDTCPSDNVERALAATELKRM